MNLDPKMVEPGDEQFEVFWSTVLNRDVCQYDYRDTDGHLFSCVAKSVDAARDRRNGWRDARHARTARPCGDEPKT